MSWTIEWSNRAIRDLERLDRGEAERVIRKFDEVIVDPSRFFKRLVGHEDYKLRIGDLRVLAFLAHSAEVILVKRVDRRSRIYQR